MNLSIRNLSVDYSDARKALDEFFKKHSICPKCNGRGYTEDEEALNEVYAQPMRTPIGAIDNLVKMREKVDNISDIVKDAIYREMKLRKTCTKCKGKKFVNKRSK